MSDAGAPVRASADRLTDVLHDLRREIDRVERRWPPFVSDMEAIGVLLEEVEELKEHVMLAQSHRNVAAMRTEAIQVATVALRAWVGRATDRGVLLGAAIDLWLRARVDAAPQPPFHSAHEGFAHLLRAYREAEAFAFSSGSAESFMRVAVTALRFALEVCDLDRARV